MKIFVSNVYSVLETSEQDILKALAKKYSCHVPGYQYTANYRRGSWNGKKKFFNPLSGKFGTGLLFSILEDLDYIDREYTIEDCRNDVDLEDPQLENIEYRDYQKRLIDKTLELKSCIIKAPTGSGKTIVIGALLKAFSNLRGILFFNKKQLLYQTSKFLSENGIEHGVAFGDGVDIKPITLCTIQSIDKIIHSHLDCSDFIMFDEIHEFARGKVASKVLRSFPTASYRIGLTATPPKEKFSKLSLTSFLGREIEFVTAEDLVEDGYLTKPSIQIIDLPETDLQQTEGMNYSDLYDEYIINNEFRNDLIVDIALSINKEHHKTLILTKNLKHAEILHKKLPGSYKLEGKDGLLERENILEEFVARKEPSIIIGTIIFQTGVDIPELTHLINARGLKSEIATIQALGRTLRKHENKTQVFIYDFMDKVPYLAKHSNSRLSAYRSLGFEVTTHGKTTKKRN